jgi:hypothetical protein
MCLRKLSISRKKPINNSDKSISVTVLKFPLKKLFVILSINNIHAKDKINIKTNK